MRKYLDAQPAEDRDGCSQTATDTSSQIRTLVGFAPKPTIAADEICVGWPMRATPGIPNLWNRRPTRLRLGELSSSVLGVDRTRCRSRLDTTTMGTTAVALPAIAALTATAGCRPIATPTSVPRYDSTNGTAAMRKTENH
ncbi:hypothetical protein [Nocardiopsis prasina]|uniref:hypothetical protein n=1 Tax=Nocardiopsis prasina TaxID=2015 RepID=UPI00037B70E7|nr:hypothetical protein [Nocardiopsis prasina]